MAGADFGSLARMDVLTRLGPTSSVGRHRVTLVPPQAQTFQRLVTYTAPVRCHDLPFAVSFHEYIGPSSLATDVFTLVRALICASEGHDGGVSVYTHLRIIECCRLEFQVSGFEVGYALRFVRYLTLRTRE